MLPYQPKSLTTHLNFNRALGIDVQFSDFIQFYTNTSTDASTETFSDKYIDIYI